MWHKVTISKPERKEDISSICQSSLQMMFLTWKSLRNLSWVGRPAEPGLRQATKLLSVSSVSHGDLHYRLSTEYDVMYEVKKAFQISKLLSPLSSLKFTHHLFFYITGYGPHQGVISNYSLPLNN